MPAQLDILAVEPFYGGARKLMLETLIRFSRHRWTLLKLPPRRMERRLVAAAQWFAEQIALHALGKVDLIFSSEALNLADFYRLIPSLAGKPSIVYFHCNQLPHPDADEDLSVPAAPSVLANLSTAATAYEMWFNSAYHHRVFFERAKALLERHVQNFSRNPLADMGRKCRLMLPPTDLGLAQHVKTASSIVRDPRTLFVDMRDAHVPMLNDAFELLRARGEKFQLITLGPANGLAPSIPRVGVVEGEDFAIMQGMLKSGVYISGQLDCVCDSSLVMAIAAGCWPMAPAAGVYPELITKPLDERCLYDCTPGGLAYTLQDFWELILPDGHQESLKTIIRPFNAVSAAKAMDDRIAELAAGAGRPT